MSKSPFTSTAPSAELNNLLKEMSTFFKSGMKLHLITYIDQHPKPHWRIAVASEHITLPRKNAGSNADVKAYNVWGNQSFSGTDRKNSEYACTESVMMLANILTLIGYDICVNNEEFNPSET